MLQLEGMTRSFPRVLANDHIDLNLRQGEIHALLGENGAGKSTLVKMIYGILRPDQGTIRWQGNEVEIDNPAMARSLGIGMVFQHFSLFESLSVYENILLGMDSATDGPALRAEIRALSERYGLPLDPERHVYTLSVGERQRIEIIRCLLQRPRLLVMDEPTSVLTPQEVERLFETLGQLAEEGMAILYISHKLDEIKALCKYATILRNGRVVGSVAVASETASSLATRMMGQELAASRSVQHNEPGKLRLKVRSLSVAADDQFSLPLNDINFEVRAGEVFGIAGVAGNGQDELLRALSGENPVADNDVIRIDGIPCAGKGPNQRRLIGLSTIPEQRLGHGAVPDMSLTDNSILTAFKRLKLTRHGLLNMASSTRFAGKVIDRFNVRSSGTTAIATSLSGGNLQKFIVGREICQAPELLIVSQPTWGVDAGAGQTIHQALRDMAAAGAAVVVISQDLDELMTICDRIAAICAGRLSTSYPVSEVGVEQVGLMMAGADVSQHAVQ